MTTGNNNQPPDPNDPYVYFVPGEVIFGIEVSRPLQGIDIFRSKSTLATAITTAINDASKEYRTFDITPSIDEERPTWIILPTDDQSSILHVKLTLSGLGDVENNDNREKNRDGLANYIVKVAEALLPASIDGPPISVSAIPGIPLKSGGIEVASIRTIMPNWVSRGAPSQIGTGGPGGQPEEFIGTSTSKIEFDTSVLDDSITNFGAITPLFSESTNQQVDVYVLDTIPQLSEENPLCMPLGAVADTTKAKYDSHPLIGLLRQCFQLRPATTDVPEHYATGVGINGNDKFTLTYAKHLQNSSFNAITKHQIDVHEANESPEHGTFIAGIVMELAPNANVHIIEVLNSKGVGTTESVLAGLAEVARRHGKSENTIAIVNCSFTFALPILTTSQLTSHITRELPLSLIRLLADPRGQNMIETFFSGVFPSNNTGHIVARFDPTPKPTERFRIVAAAGNDSDRNGENKTVVPTAIPPTVGEPRYPARYRGVLGVGALTKVGHQIANYSNQADIPEKEGLLTLGKITSVFTKGLSNAVASSPKRTGFVTWQGTSFAAAVISGMLAKICTERKCGVNVAEQIIRAAQTEKIDNSEVIDISQNL